MYVCINHISIYLSERRIAFGQNFGTGDDQARREANHLYMYVRVYIYIYIYIHPMKYDTVIY